MPVAVGVAGVLVSAYSTVQAGQQHKRAMALQQSALQADQAFRQQQLEEYERNYGPIRDELTKQASSESPLNLGPTWSKIQANFDQAGRNNEISMARKGMLGSGLDQKNTLETGRAYTLSNAFSQGLQARDSLRERLLAAGKQMPGQVGLVAQGNQNMTDFYGQQAGMWGNAAGQGAQGLASSLGALGYALGQRPQAAPQPDISSMVDSRMVQNALGSSPITLGNMTPSFDGSSLPLSLGGN